MLKDKVLADLDTVIKTASLLQQKVKTVPATPTDWLELGQIAGILGISITNAAIKLHAWASLETDKIPDHADKANS